ncbi:MAG: DUF3971 domain-containing protein [Pseudomonadota bacterium]
MIAIRSRTKKRLRNTIRWGLLSVLAMFVAATLLLYRLHTGPLSVPFVTGIAAERVERMLGPASAVSIVDTRVSWQGGTAFTAHLDGVSVDTGPIGANRQPIVTQLKSLIVEFSLNPVGPRFFSPDDVRAIGLDATIPWPPPVPAPQSPWPMPVGPLDGANRITDRVLAEHAGGLSVDLSIVDGRIRRLADPDGQAEPWLDDLAGLVSLDGENDVLSVVATGVSARKRSFDIGLERRGDSEGGHEITLKVRGFDFPFNPKAAANPDKNYGWLPVDLAASGSFGSDYGFRSAEFLADIGPGTLPLGPQDSTYLKAAGFTLVFDPDIKGFRFRRGHVAFGDSVVDVTGTVIPRSLNPLDPWAFELSSRNAVIDPVDVPGPPVVVEDLVASGRIVPRERSLYADRVAVLSERAPMESIWNVTLAGKGMMVSGAANIGRISVDNVKRLWPSFAATETRQWFLDNLKAGLVERARIDVSLPPAMTDGDPATSGGEDNAVDLAVAFAGVTLKTFGDLPPVTEGTGYATLKKRRLDVVVDRAAFEAPDGGRADASRGRVVIADVFRKDKTGDVSFLIEGETGSVGSIADQEPVKALKQVGVASDDLSGEVSARVEARFPLRNEIAPEDVLWRVDAEFDGLTSAAPIAGRTISDADVTVVVEPDRLTMRGVATLDGVRADIQIEEPYGDPTLSMSGDLTLTLSEKERIERGIDLGDLLRGPVAVGIIVMPDGKQRYAVDLTTALVTIPVFGWTKGKGIPGQATFILSEQGNRYVLDDFSLRAGEAAIDGRIVLAEGGGIASADIDRFTIRKGDRATIEAELTGADRYSITFAAKQFDGRGLIKSIKAQQLAEEEEPYREEHFTVVFKAASLLGFEGETLRGLSGDLVMDVDGVERFEASGGVGRDGRADFAIARAGDRSAMTVTSSDTGALLRFMDVYDGIEGGEGFLETRTEADGQTTGHVKITDMTMRTTEEFSSRLAQTGRDLNNQVADDGLILDAPSRTDANTSFEKFRASFDKRGSRLTVTEAFIRSPLLGGSFAGDIDLAREVMALSGTMIPVYGLNNLFGQIPVLGQLMGAGRHGGLVGVTFRIDGPITEPKLALNPASALAPGIFRRIFEFR